MNTLFGFALVLGILALLGWIALSAVAGGVAGWDRYDPERLAGVWGRRSTLALVGFGMAGLSASYAGWPTVAVLAAAAVGAVGLSIVGELLAPPTR